ncbi:Uncharacterized protein AB751O23_AD_00190 [Chlamydiales bacterium SCGC AB-751-O23]|jgi:hypothetical protein|nr:Uncharacterized protein AB751O23_AD_00190 [Chlamydiales bacterium SCGC AB-751-O23]
MNENFFQSRKFLIPFNLCSFYLLWILIITEVAKRSFFISPVILLCFLVLHLILSKQSVLELFFICSFTLLGTLIESALLHLELYHYAPLLSLHSKIPPLWVACIYLLMSTTFSSSLYWLRKKHLALTSSLGFLGGASSYWFGYQTKVFHFDGSILTALLCLSLYWMFLFPFGFFMRKNLALMIKS